MTMQKLMALEMVWEINPPPAVSLAIIARSKGMKPGKRKSKKKKADENAAVELARDLRGMQ